MTSASFYKGERGASNGVYFEIP